MSENARRVEAMLADLPSKRVLKDELVRALESQLATSERAHQVTREAATHEEAKPENDKDTRALEQSYVARGQALRIEDLRAGLGEVRALTIEPFAEGRPAALGALVIVEEDERQRSFFIVPYGGGIELADGAVQVVTTKSPLGRLLLGKRVGEACEAQVGGRTRELQVIAVR